MKKRNLALAIGGGIGAAVAVKMLTRASTVDWESVRPDVIHSEHSRFVNVDGIRLHYQEFGDAAATPMLLIHGYTASVYVWKTVAPMLADAGFRVIAIDLVGFGFSEKPHWFDYTIQSQAHIVGRFIQTIGVGQTIVVGSSYGGAVSLELALSSPEFVERLVLVDAVINDDPLQHPILRLASLPGVGEALTPFLIDSKFFLRVRMSNTLAPANHAMITDERIASIRRPLNAADAHHSVLATSRNWRASRIERDLDQIDHKTLIIWGDQDRVIPIRNGYKLREEILHSRMIVLRDCGHVPQEEKSELFTKMVVDFCRDEKGRIAATHDDAKLVT